MGFGRGHARPRARMTSGAIDRLELRVVWEILGGLEVCMTANAADGSAVGGCAESFGVDKDRASVRTPEILIAVADKAVGVFDLNGGLEDRPCGQDDADGECDSFQGITWPAMDA